MKEWNVIWSNDIEPFRAKKQALKRAFEIFDNGLDYNVSIVDTDDTWEDGYASKSNFININEMRNNYGKCNS